MIMDMYFGQMQQCKVVQKSGLPGLIFIILPAHLTTNKTCYFIFYRNLLYTRVLC